MGSVSPVQDIDLAVSLDRASYVPYYEQIILQLRDAIKGKQLRPGQMLWSQRELAEKLGISVLPVKRAFERLRTEGLLLTSKGKRPIVGSGGVPWNVQDLSSFSEEIRERGLSLTTRLLGLDLVEAEAEVAEALELGSNKQVYRLRRLRSVQKEPVALETTHLPAGLFPQLESQDWEKVSLYSVMEHVYGRTLERGEERIGAVKAGHDEAHLLKIEVGFPLLLARRLAYDINNTPIEYGITLRRADRNSARIFTLRRRP